MEIGKGSFGEVYKSKNKTQGREVALKIYNVADSEEVKAEL